MAFWDFEEDICLIDKNKSESIETKWVKRDDKEYIVHNVIRRGKDDETFSYTGKTVVIPMEKYKTINDKVLLKIEEKSKN